jgi:hypothetical protein
MDELERIWKEATIARDTNNLWDSNQAPPEYDSSGTTTPICLVSVIHQIPFYDQEVGMYMVQHKYKIDHRLHILLWQSDILTVLLQTFF